MKSVVAAPDALGARPAAADPRPLGPDESGRWDSPTRLVIEWAGTYGSTIYMMEVRNTGSQGVDLGRFQLAAGSCASSPDAGFRVIKGSASLAPGERALILTHSSVPTDDEPRQQYAHLLVATGLADSLTIQDGSSLTLVDPSGGFPDVPLGPIEEHAGVGVCCKPTQQAPCCSNPFGPCQQGAGACAVQVTKAYCCGTLQWCGFRESDESGACAPGCHTSVTWNCCNTGTCP